jgi:hypothetical protein
MFIVKHPFKYSKNGEIITAKVGDEIPDFEKWPYPVQKAHIDIEWVEVVQGLNEPEIRPRKPKKKG